MLNYDTLDKFTASDDYKVLYESFRISHLIDSRAPQCRNASNREIIRAIYYMHLLHDGTFKQVELERKANIRQPNASALMTYLITLNWAKCIDADRAGKGRPSLIYKLVKPLSEIIGEIISGCEKYVDEKRESFSKLKTLVETA